MLVRHAKRQHLRTVLADLPRRKIHDRENLAAEQLGPCVIRSQLCQRLFRAKLLSKINHEDVRGIATFGERLHLAHSAHPNVEFLEILSCCRILFHTVDFTKGAMDRIKARAYIGGTDRCDAVQLLTTGGASF